MVRHELHRLVFSNPGTLLVSKNQYYEGGESVCRNKSLQKMFSMLGVAEKAGSGTDKIMKGWREANWRSPQIDELQAPDKVVLTMPMESFLSDGAKAKLTEKYGIMANSFDHNVLTILALACDEGYVTNERLRYSLNLHKAEIADILKRMTHEGLLISEGYGRGMRYLLPQGSVDYLKMHESNVATSDPNVATSASNVATSASNVATSIKKKMSREDLQVLILSHCKDWVSLDLLSSRIKRNPKYLRNVVIPVLIASKKLQMLYPGTPNHPNQKYKISD